MYETQKMYPPMEMFVKSSTALSSIDRGNVFGLDEI